MGLSVAALFVLIACSVAAQDSPEIPKPDHRPLIAIIIDDLGYQEQAGARATRLPGAVTLAVLPFAPHSQSLAQLGRISGKELMLHAPMEPYNDVPWESDGLSSQLSREELQLNLNAMLEALPQITGVNNHMGSKLTANAPAMGWVMNELKHRQLFFVDSLTNPASVAWSAARQLHVPSIRRDIFLDNEPQAEAIAAQLEKLVRIARRRGYALAIGHPYHSTLEVLEAYLPQLPALGVELVPVSQLILAADQTPSSLTTQN